MKYTTVHLFNKLLRERELPCHWTFVDNNVVWGHPVAEDTLFQRMSSDEVIFSLKIRHCLSLDIRG